MTAAIAFELSSQALHGHFSSSVTVTLRRRSDPTVAPLTEVPVCFSDLTIEDLAEFGPESGMQPVSIARLDLGDFRLDAGAELEIAGQRYPFQPSGGPSAGPAVSAIGDSRSSVTGFIQMGL